MSRRVPELAVLVGAVLVVPFLTYAVVFGVGPLPTALTVAAVLYPLALYTVARMDDPTGLLPPRVGAAAAGLAALLLLGYGLLTGQATLGLLAGAAVGLPPALYYHRYESPLPARPAAAAAGALAVVALAHGALFGGALVGVLAAAVLGAWAWLLFP